MATAANIQLSEALAAHRQGNLRTAEAGYLQVLNADPGNAEAWLYLGTLAHQRGYKEIAIARLEKAIALHPASLEARYNLGTILQEMGKTAEARQQYELILQHTQDYPYVYLNLSILEEMEGRIAEAKTLLQKAIGIMPFYADAHYRLGLLLQKSGEPGAQAHFDLAMSANPAYRQAVAALTGI